jgi:hypothetical protein
MTQTQDEAERLIRQERNAQRSYKHDVRGIKAEAAPHEATVKDYNTQVEGFKDSAIHYKKSNAEGGVDDVLWQVVGYLSGDGVHQPVNYPGGWNVPGAPQSSSVVMPTVDGKDAGMYRGSGVNSQGMYGYYGWGNSSAATLRDVNGAPVRAWQSSADNAVPIQAYASRNDKPFVAPLTQSQIDNAKSADAALTEIGGRAEARGAEYGKTAGLIETRADRLALDSEMLQNRASQEPEAIGNQSVFDQNTKVFQSIADWLR